MDDLMEGALVPVVYVVSNDLVKVSSLLPSNKKRSLLVHSLVDCIGLMTPEYSQTRRIQILNPGRASYKDLSIYHSRDYLDFILDPQNSSTEMALGATTNAEFGLEDDCPTFPGLPDYVRLVAGATLTAASSLKEGISDIALCWDGGRHHAQRSHAAGFCYVADCILAIISLRKLSLNHPQPCVHKPRVLYLDLDLHFSDAVSQAFFSPGTSVISQTLTLSIHHTATGFFPVSHLADLPSPEDPAFDPFTLSLPLKQGASDGTFAKIWPIINRVKDTFRPDFIIVQCGVDCLAGDPCAIFNLSLGGRQGSLGWCVEQILTWPGKKLFLGGGGYNSPNAARAWTYLTSVVLGKPLSLEAEIPDHSGFPLYSPSFTLDVPAGNMQDLNDDQYLLLLESRYDAIIQSLEKRLHP